MTVRKVGTHEVEVSHEGKVFFPESGITKGDLIDYYAKVAGTILPHLEGRPISMERYPDGITGESFYQKEVPEYFPPWIHRVTIPSHHGGGSQLQVVCDTPATLVYLADLGCITPHTWLSREVSLTRPDRMVLDLDPPGTDFAPVRAVAFLARDLLEEVGLHPRVMTTGSRGVHLVVPIIPSLEFGRVRTFAESVAGILAERHPDLITDEIRKEKRGERVFIDALRNAYGATAVPPYAVRARPGAPVATPITWEELEDTGIHSRSFTIRNIFDRLGRKGDLWKGFHEQGQSLEEVIRDLRKKK
jgi:bifunctional non-homologous end joining protein LigD